MMSQMLLVWLMFLGSTTKCLGVITPPRILHGGWTPIIPGHPFYFGPRNTFRQSYTGAHSHNVIEQGHSADLQHAVQQGYTVVPQKTVQHANHGKNIYSYYPSKSITGPQQVQYKPLYIELPRKPLELFEIPKVRAPLSASAEHGVSHIPTELFAAAQEGLHENNLQEQTYLKITPLDPSNLQSLKQNNVKLENAPYLLPLSGAQQYQFLQTTPVQELREPRENHFLSQVQFVDQNNIGMGDNLVGYKEEHVFTVPQNHIELKDQQRFYTGFGNAYTSHAGQQGPQNFRNNVPNINGNQKIKKQLAPQPTHYYSQMRNENAVKQIQQQNPAYQLRDNIGNQNYYLKKPQVQNIRQVSMDHKTFSQAKPSQNIGYQYDYRHAPPPLHVNQISNLNENQNRHVKNIAFSHTFEVPNGHIGHTNQYLSPRNHYHNNIELETVVQEPSYIEAAAGGNNGNRDQANYLKKNIGFSTPLGNSLTFNSHPDYVFQNITYGIPYQQDARHSPELVEGELAIVHVPVTDAEYLQYHRAQQNENRKETLILTADTKHNVVDDLAELRDLLNRTSFYNNDDTNESVNDDNSERYIYHKVVDDQHQNEKNLLNQQLYSLGNTVDSFQNDDQSGIINDVEKSLSATHNSNGQNAVNNTGENRGQQVFHAYYASADHKPPQGYTRMSVKDFDRLFRNAEIRFVDKEPEITNNDSTDSSNKSET